MEQATEKGEEEKKGRKKRVPCIEESTRGDVSIWKLRSGLNAVHVVHMAVWIEVPQRRWVYVEFKRLAGVGEQHTLISNKNIFKSQLHYNKYMGIHLT